MYEARIWRCQLTILPHEVIYQAVAQLVGVQYVWAVLICFYAIVAKCFGPLEAAHCYSDND